MGYNYERCNYMFMRGNIGILMVIAVMCPPCLQAGGMLAVKEIPTVEALVGHLESMSPFSAVVDYEVTLPMADDDVTYTLELASDTVQSDPLSAMDYLIRWSLNREGGASNGFSAYFDGHHYRYRNNRLQEYHYEWDSIPFNSAAGGVQRNAQFVELLPQSIASELKRMIASDDFTVGYEPVAVEGGRDVSVVMASQTVKGFVGRNYRLVVDRASGVPLRIDNEYNPGQISEQSVTAKYNYPPASTALKAVRNEAQLMAMYPEVFEKFRESNYRIENMRGLRMPAFSLPTLTGERYSRQRDDGFKAPTVIAIIDPAVATAKATVEALRGVQARMPRDIDIILAFTGSNTDAIEEIAGAPSTGETDLISAKSLARDCGIAVFPTVMVVDREGVVTNVLLGFNNSLADDVIQSVALLD